MPTYLLDTNTFSYLMSEHESVKAHIAALDETDRIVISSIVRGEIRYGIERMPAGKRRSRVEEKAEKLFSVIPCISVSEDTADNYGKLKREAEQQGNPLGENDLWIAATTLVNHSVLVTNDTDFERIGKLTIEDWIE